MSTAKPNFLHNCKECIFLGHFDKHDLYYCPSGAPTPRLKARFDHDDVDMKWCVASARRAEGDRHLLQAFQIALKSGLLFEDGRCGWSGDFDTLEWEDPPTLVDIPSKKEDKW